MLQLFAALLEANPAASLSDYYKSLIPPILTVDFWSSRGNVPALVRLLVSIIPRGASEMTANNQLESILGIFKQLVEKKANEVHAFELLECILSYFPPYDQHSIALSKPILTNTTGMHCRPITALSCKCFSQGCRIAKQKPLALVLFAYIISYQPKTMLVWERTSSSTSLSKYNLGRMHTLVAYFKVEHRLLT